MTNDANDDPSPDTIRALAEVFKLAAILDDRLGGADKGRILAWSKQAERHKLIRDDLLDGLQRFYDSPSSHAIGIGDLIAHSRASRRDRNEREEDEIREIRRETQDAQAAADETQAVAAGFISGPTPTPTTRLFEAEHALQRCKGKREAMAAIGEYFAAKRAARLNPPKVTQ